MQELFDLQLFLGLPIQPSVEQALKKGNPHKISILSSGGAAYLQYVQFDEQQYLGKFIGKTVQLKDLILLEKNIFSILSQMLPNYPIEKHELVLLTLKQSNGNI